jgi:hypothetical protein
MPARTIQPSRTVRGDPPANRSPITSATARAPMNQPMSACSWVTDSSEKWNLGTVVRWPWESIVVPARGPVPVTTVPAASMSAVIPASTPASTRRSARAGGGAGEPAAAAARAAARACRTTALVRMTAVDNRKWAATSAGFSLVRTTIPPTTAWAMTPRGKTAESQTRSFLVRSLAW